MYRLRRNFNSCSFRRFLCSALSSDMYRLRHLLCSQTIVDVMFCIKQRYVSIKTKSDSTNRCFWKCSALSSDMYRLRHSTTGTLVPAKGSALSSDMYRLRHFISPNPLIVYGSALSSDMYRLRPSTGVFLLQLSVLH